MDSPKSPKFKDPQRRHFLFIKHCVSSSFSPNSGFLAFWCLFSKTLASSWPLLASSWPLLASSWPGLFWPLLASFWPFAGFAKNPKIRWPPETSFSVHNTLRFELFFTKFWIPGLLGPVLASSWPLLALSWPVPGLFWPLPGLSWPLLGLFRASPGLFLASSGIFLASFWLFPGFSKISKIQTPAETSFSVHKTLRFELFFTKFWIPGVLVPFFEYFYSLAFSSSWPLPGLFWPLPGLFWPLPGLFSPLPGLFRASSGLFLASFWPFLGFSKISNIQEPPETSFFCS